MLSIHIQLQSIPASFVSPALYHMIVFWCASNSDPWRRKMASSTKSASDSSGRHLRRLCGHCNEELSYSAYRSHRALYYLESERRWISDSQLSSEDGQCNEETSMIEGTQIIDQIGIIKTTYLSRALNLSLIFYSI